MKAKILSVLAVAAIGVSSVSFYQSYTKSQLVYVDVNKLVDGYSRTKSAKAEFEKKAAGLKANVDTLMQKWEKELQIYERERNSLSSKELQLKQELLSNKQQQISSYQQAVQKQIEEEDRKVTQTVLNEINDYVKEYGNSKGYKIIFGASGGGNIMYADESCDLTEEILKGLNAEYAR